MIKKIKYLLFRWKMIHKYGELGYMMVSTYEEGIERGFVPSMVTIKYTISRRAVLIPRYGPLKNNLVNYMILNLIFKDGYNKHKWIKK
jgi:hypothetical protein